MTRNNRSYTKEFIKESVSFALSFSSIKSAANELGIPHSTLVGWINKSKIVGEFPASSDQAINVGDILKENRELKKRLSLLEEEKAILKKAATYFAKELR